MFARNHTRTDTTHAQVAFNEHILVPLAKLSADPVLDLTIMDAGELCREREAVSFWELVRRAQQADSVLVRVRLVCVCVGGFRTPRLRSCGL